MKKTYFYGIASAAFVVGSMCLASCSADQPIAEEGGSGSSTPGREVKTTLAITVEDGGDDDVTNVTNLTSKMGTRMSADATQNYIKEGKTVATFHHFYKMAMMTYKTTPTANTAWTKLIQLGSSTSKANSKDSNQRQLYVDIAVPTETSNVLFYALGPQSGLTETSASFPISKENNGVLLSDYYAENNAPTSPSRVKFALEKRYTGNGLAGESSAKQIVEQLNKLMNVNGILVKEDSTTIATSKDYTDIKDKKDGKSVVEQQHELMQQKAYVSFKDMVYSAEKNHTAQVKILQEMRDELVKLTSGSAAAVKSALLGLQTNLPKVGTVSVSDTAMAMRPFLYWQLYQEVGKALTVLGNNKFPTDQNLPEGAVKLTYSNDAKDGPFSYVIQANNTSIVTGDYALDNAKVTYPASLAYFCNTPVMTSNSPISDMANELPTVENWKQANWKDKTNWKQEAVGENTQSIALQRAITYGVAQLKTTVRCGAEKLKDSKWKENESTDADKISVPVDGYTLTGVLIGGQPDKVDWQFNPMSDAGFDHTIYDSYMNTSDGKSAANDDGTPKAAGAISAKYSAENTKSTPNYTLVLDNQRVSTTKESDKVVYIALEFVNTGSAFYGAQGGLIPNGSKFYLVGKLDPSKGTKPSTTSDTGTTTTLDHVFVKGYTTTANFVIGETSLQKATNTIPDLRTAELSLGLMVDFTWKDGLTFDDVVLE